MKCLVLDGGREGDFLTTVAFREMIAALEGRKIDVHPVRLREHSIAPCTGCFGCWTRTPGECVIGDDARDILMAYLGSDIAAYVSPVTFGGYSSLLKTILDRLIPVLDPRFAIVGGEVHHRLRYRRYPKTIVLGTLPSSDPEAERLFATLVARNGINLHRVMHAEILVGVKDPASARRCAERLLDRVRGTP